jgi:hypothetical protein
VIRRKPPEPRCLTGQPHLGIFDQAGALPSIGWAMPAVGIQIANFTIRMFFASLFSGYPIGPVFVLSCKVTAPQSLDLGAKITL